MSLTQSNQSSMSTVAPTKTVVETVVETATATITKTITETTTATPRRSHTGWPISAIIGIAVTSLVAAVALFVIVGLLYRKRRQHEPSPVTSPETSPETSSEASPNASRKPSPKEDGTATGFVVRPNRCLLTGASDSDIEKELRSLGLVIQWHVENNYHRDNIPVTPEALQSSLRQLQLSEDTCCMVARLSIDPNTRCLAIRHLLALVIFSNLDVHTVGSLSLLPPTLKELSRSRAMTPKDEEDILVETAWLLWHRLTAFLMHENPDRRTRLLPPPSVEPRVEALIMLLQKFLVHFVRIDDDHSVDKQQAGLAGVLRQCVKFGYEVFSHPTDWEFTYPQQEQEHNFVVVPGLLKRSTNEGELCRPPRMLLPPKIGNAT
ncbi:uncharacterized protein B0J16DRAFT_373927 [Fusarium flagelliforme]|uniref:Uncharacterized protein n=1 Tax=Fusarium flagelliforme TaxID=2675880 RepID=A0A395MBQ6_9HYPO|nr:uncharacterized protein B0J16DRAFT_373927 [Fusarium flagelliforme]KAH7183482.1 hypothetical protein B0J16DRAFT_373927 [Fusarium flagelliforme]RFN45347.1 hypothetical protein FIE12Z_10412 [Fusarium flagelliforme]